ncbi:MAG: hypothetical protein OQJ95_03955 [Kangiella sp.]|jgi:hypothetical protein|nr:hypothetical protein [Kangiella sp.]MCW9027987.1 hypothetical protein [Kangiella sp.]
MKRILPIFLITLLIIVLVQACSNVPLSTMLKMSSFDEEDFIRLNPEELRVRVRSNTKTNVIEANQLTYSYKDTETYIDQYLSLEKLEEEKIRTVKHWFKDDSVEHISWYRLDEEGVEQFRALQKHPFLQDKDREGTFELSVQTVYTEDSPLQFLLSVDLLLEPEDGYFTLFYDLEIDQTSSVPHETQ